MPFASIKGHDKQVATLKQAIERRSVAHAYLFSGIPGIGKKTTAWAFTKALNCKSHSADFCDECLSCQKITNNQHPDVHYLYPEGEQIKIHQIRRIQEYIRYKPYEGNYQVVIISQAEKMNVQASNCLLKALEEPPANTVFLLVTAAPFQILPTVRSRCQRVAFSPLSPTLIEEMLSRHFNNKNGTVKLCSSLAEGSIGRARQWCEDERLQERKKILTGLAHLSHSHPLTFLDLAQLLGEDKARAGEYLELLGLWLRDLLIFKETGEETLIINKDLTDLIRTVARVTGLSELFAALQKIDEIKTALRFNVNTRLAMEVMLSQLQK